MINILIIEDHPDHFQKMVDALMQYLGDIVEVFPKNIDNKENNLNNCPFVIEKLQDGKFQEVAQFYENIDLFIIDASLTPTLDTIGIDFHNYLQRNKKRQFKTIIVSNTDDMKRQIDERAFPFISKIKHGTEENFPIVLVQTFKKLFHLSDFNPEGELSTYQKLKRDLNLYGWKFAFHSIWIYFTKNVQRRIIDKLIFILFYILIITTVLSGGFNIIRTIADCIFYHIYDETLILKIAESIFINLLPIFIVFGFFNYYKTNTRIMLLEGNTFSVNEDISTKTMNLTKTLFISTVISYVIIKGIEKIFIEKEAEIINLVSFGTFLTLLMLYFLLLDKKYGKGKKQNRLN